MLNPFCSSSLALSSAFKPHNMLSLFRGITILLLLGSLFTLQAQSINKPISEKLEKPIYVVLDDRYGEQYLSLIQEMVEKTWTLSAYEFVRFDESEELRADVNNVFLFLTSNEGIDADVRQYKSVITLATFARQGRFRSNITGAPIDLESSNAARLSMMHGLRMIQDKARYEMAKQAGDVTDFKSFMSERRSRHKESTLYLNRAYVDMDRGELAKLYTGPIELISRNELLEMMAEPREGALYAYLQSFKIPGSTVVEKSIIDAKSGEILFYSTSSGPVASEQLNKKDFKAME